MTAVPTLLLVLASTALTWGFSEEENEVSRVRRALGGVEWESTEPDSLANYVHKRPFGQVKFGKRFGPIKFGKRVYDDNDDMYELNKRPFGPGVINGKRNGYVDKRPWGHAFSTVGKRYTDVLDNLYLQSLLNSNRDSNIWNKRGKFMFGKRSIDGFEDEQEVDDNGSDVAPINDDDKRAKFKFGKRGDFEEGIHNDNGIDKVSKEVFKRPFGPSITVGKRPFTSLSLDRN